MLIISTTRLFSLLLLFSWWLATCAGTQSSTVSESTLITVTNDLNVIRGGKSNAIGNLYTINTTLFNETIAHCNVLTINSDYCGTIYPTNIDCTNTTTTQRQQIFQHYGCLNPYEIINFQVEILTDTNVVYAKVFSISVHILPNPLPFQLLVTNNTLLRGNNKKTLTFLFPLSFTNRCSYTVETNHIPNMARNKQSLINGLLSHPIPCGYSPTSPFYYYPNSTMDITLVICTICLTDKDGSTTANYHIVPLSKTNVDITRLIQLPTSYLHIREMSESIVTSSLFHFDALTKKYSYNNLSLLKFVFPVEYTGGLYSLYSFNQGSLTATTFTMKELKNGIIIFRPKQSSIASYLATVTLFHYYVLDWSGRPIAEGILNVKFSPRMGMMPSIRKNSGIVVEKGKTASLTFNQLNFYPPLLCVNYTITMVTAPLKGILIAKQSNQKPLQANDIILVTNNNLNIVYQHSNDNLTTSRLDTTLWSIDCHGLSPNSTNITVLIPFRILTTHISFPSSPTHCSMTVLTYKGMGTPLHAHINESCRLHGSITVVTLPATGNLISVPTASSCLPNSYFPYVLKNRLTSCLINNITNTSTVIEWRNLWYMAPFKLTNNDTLISSHIKLYSKDTNQYITLHIKTQSGFNFMKTSQSLGLLVEFYPTLPFITTNLPLPLFTHTTPVYITSHFLYVYSLGYLQKDILFRVLISPEFGFICVFYDVECSESVQTFTQEDILAQRVYYKPNGNNSLLATRQDSFKFQVFYLGRHKIPGTFTFYTRLFENPLPLSPWRQFWVSSKKEKPLARKHLRHFQRYFNTKKLTFTILKLPQHGIINHHQFTWDDLFERKVTYRHTDPSTCSDVMTLKITTNTQQSIVANFTIAIKSSNRRVLRGNSFGHRVDREKSFELSRDDFDLESNFCFEFIKFTVDSIPTYGLLRYRDNHSETTIQLQANDTFTGLDVIEKRLVYEIFPDLVFFHETEDNFKLSLKDPQGVPKRQSRSVATSIFFIYINPETQIEKRLNLTIVSPKLISKLDTIYYGSVFDRSDMFLSNDSDFIPPDVLFRLKKSPAFGKIQKERAPVNEFSLQDIYSKKISYISSLYHTDTNITSDQFEFSIHVMIEKTTRLYTRSVKFVVEWCYFAISSASNRVAKVEETSPNIALFVKIIGAKINIPANVTLITMEQEGNETATQGNCTTLQTTPNHADYCSVNTRVYFNPGSRKGLVRVPIMDDYLAEGLELFVVGLRDPQTCLVPVHSEINVFIVDYADYPLIKFSRNHNQEQNLIDKNVCPIQFSVQETISTVNITLTRTGNLNQTNGVICYTKSPTPDSDNDYIHRPNNKTSIVYFQPGQVYANCTVNIVNDGDNEPSEYFFVYLGAVVTGYAFIDHSSSPVCVFVEHDREDVPFVSFERTQIIVKERRDRPVSANFTILRKGTDLNRETNLLCQVIPNKGNATGGVDYSLSFINEIKFASGQTKATGQIEIMADRKKEGNEVFYVLMKEPYNGRINSSGRVMEIVIIDALENMLIGFSLPSFTISETVLFAQIPLYRRGNLDIVTNVTCILTPGTADLTDFFEGTRQVVVFPVNSTQQACGLIIHDDNNREGKETLTISIVTSDPYVKIANEGKTTIIIDDSEDSPIVQFKESIIYTSEPLSNNNIDYKQVLVPLERRLGPNVNASVLYTTIDTNNGRPYVPSSGKIVFPIGVNKQYIPIQILANHSYHGNQEFYIRLYTNGGYDTRIGTRNITRVIVRNTLLKGVYFPDRPRVMSYVNNTPVSFNGTVYYDLPLICVTSCDPELVTNNTQHFKAECTKQSIGVSNTIYTWWMSQDGNNFIQLKLDTLFTSTSSQVLEAVYISSNKWIKCTAQAVDDRGIRGYTRTSEVVYLSDQTYGNYDNMNIWSEFNAYSGFQASDKDMIHLSVTIPGAPNIIPILTSERPNFQIISLLTHPLARSLHPCSSLTQSGQLVSFISREPFSPISKRRHNSFLFYRHFNTTSSLWLFKIWLPMKHLINTCNAKLTNNPLRISMSLYISLTTITNDRAILVKQARRIVTLKQPQRYTNIIFPFNYYPVEKSQSLYFAPLSVRMSPNKLQLIGYTYSQLNHTIDYLISENNQLVYPVYSDASDNSTVYGWVINVNMERLSSKFNVTFRLYLCRVVENFFQFLTRSCVRYSFILPFQFDRIDRNTLSYNNRIKMDTILMISARRNERIANLTGQHILHLSITHDPSFIMKHDYMLAVTAVSLCPQNNSTLQNHGCSNDNSTIVIMENNNGLIESVSERKNTSHLILYFKLDSLLDTLYTQRQWYIEIQCNIQTITSNNIISSGKSLITLPSDIIQLRPTITNTVTVTNTSELISTPDTLPTYAFVLILLTIVVLVSVCSVTGVLFVYMLRQKWVLHRQKCLLNSDDILKTSDTLQVPYSTRQHYTATPVIIRRPRSYKRYSTSSSTSSKRSCDSHTLSIDSNSTLQPSLRRSRSLPTIPSSREMTPLHEITNSSTDTVSPPNSTIRTSTHLINELQSLPTKERRNVLIATVKPLTRSQVDTHNESSSPTTPTKGDKDHVLDINSIKKSLQNHSSYKPYGVGWYERHQTRQKALALYSQLYLVNPYCNNDDTKDHTC